MNTRVTARTGPNSKHHTYSAIDTAGWLLRHMSYESRLMVQFSRYQVSGSTPYRDARAPVMNTIPTVKISARIKVMVVISGARPNPMDQGSSIECPLNCDG